MESRVENRELASCFMGPAQLSVVENSTKLLKHPWLIVGDKDARGRYVSEVDGQIGKRGRKSVLPCQEAKVPPSPRVRASPPAFIKPHCNTLFAFPI
jgi:hypothetical protein